MPVRPQSHAQAIALAQPVRDVTRGDARAGTAVALVTDRRDQEMRLVADLASRGGDRIGARHERPRDRLDLLRRERRRKRLNEIDELPPRDPGRCVAGIEQGLRLPMAGRGDEILKIFQRKRGDVARRQKLRPERVVAG